VANDPQEMRTRAVDFVNRHTGRLESLTLRDSIITSFVQNVERHRRRLQSTTRVAAKKEALDVTDLPDSVLFG